MCLKKIPQAFYSRALYRDAAQHGRGLGFSYLFLLETLVVGVLTLVALFYYLTRFDASAFTETYLGDVISQIPATTIHEDGKITIDKKEPYRIKLFEHADSKKDRYITFDSSRSEIATDEFMLISGSKILFKDDKKFETKSYDLAEIFAAYKSRAEKTGEDIALRGFTFDSAMARNWTIETLSYIWLFFLPVPVVLILCFFVYRILQALLYGLFGLLFSKLLRANLRYEQVVRLVSLNATVVILLGWSVVLLQIAGLCFSLSGWIYFLISMGYLLFAISAAKSAQDQV